MIHTQPNQLFELLFDGWTIVGHSANGVQLPDSKRGETTYILVQRGPEVRSLTITSEYDLEQNTGTVVRVIETQITPPYPKGLA